jgi:hypothetical protein
MAKAKARTTVLLKHANGNISKTIQAPKIYKTSREPSKAENAPRSSHPHGSPEGFIHVLPSEGGWVKGLGEGVSVCRSVDSPAHRKGSERGVVLAIFQKTVREDSSRSAGILSRLEGLVSVASSVGTRVVIVGPDLNERSDFISQYAVVTRCQWPLERDQAWTYIASGSYWGMYTWTLSTD